MARTYNMVDADGHILEPLDQVLAGGALGFYGLS
jgi:hypothetical protein